MLYVVLWDNIFFVWLAIIVHLFVLDYYFLRQHAHYGRMVCPKCDVNMPCISMLVVESYYVCHFGTCFV